jgi:hypothetical protein
MVNFLYKSVKILPIPTHKIDIQRLFSIKKGLYLHLDHISIFSMEKKGHIIIILGRNLEILVIVVQADTQS